MNQKTWRDWSWFSAGVKCKPLRSSRPGWPKQFLVILGMTLWGGFLLQAHSEFPQYHSFQKVKNILKANQQSSSKPDTHTAVQLTTPLLPISQWEDAHFSLPSCLAVRSLLPTSFRVLHLCPNTAVVLRRRGPFEIEQWREKQQIQVVLLLFGR